MHYKIEERFLLLFIHFTNLINARNLEHILVNLLRCALETRFCPYVVTGK